MTLINGRVVGINQREFSLRTGSDEESHGGGMIYEVDPAAVAHFKAVLASQPPRKPQAISSQRQKQSGRLDADLQRKVNELAARARAKALAAAETIETVETKEFDMAEQEKPELAEAGKIYPDDIILAAEQMMAKSPKARRWGDVLDERVVAVWRQWLDDGIGYDAIAQNNGLCPISESTVRRLVAQYPTARTSAPVPYPVATAVAIELTETAVREAHGRFTRGESVKVLAVELGVPWQTLQGQFRRYGLAGRQEAGKSKPVRAAGQVETAVVPVQETAVAATSPTPPTDLREQLGVIQELLGLAEAQSVTLRGKISVDLHAEVAF